jgi:hypothetical protein
MNAPILLRLALAFLAGKLDASNPVAVVELLAELGRLIPPEKAHEWLAAAWDAITRAAAAIQEHKRIFPDATEAHLERILSDGGMADDLVLPPAQLVTGEPGGGPTGGEG